MEIAIPTGTETSVHLLVSLALIRVLLICNSHTVDFLIRAVPAFTACWQSVVMKLRSSHKN